MMNWKFFVLFELFTQCIAMRNKWEIKSLGATKLQILKWLYLYPIRRYDKTVFRNVDEFVNCIQWFQQSSMITPKNQFNSSTIIMHVRRFIAFTLKKNVHSILQYKMYTTNPLDTSLITLHFWMYNISSNRT